MRLRDRPTDRQAEPETARFPGAVLAPLVERLEDPAEQLRLDPDAGVRHPDLHRGRRGGAAVRAAGGRRYVACVDGDRAPGRGEPGGVLDEVPDHLLDAQGVGLDRRPRGFEAQLQGQAGVMDQVGAGRQGLADDGLGLDPLGVQLELPAGHPGDVQQVVDEPRFQLDPAACGGQGGAEAVGRVGVVQ